VSHADSQMLQPSSAGSPLYFSNLDGVLADDIPPEAVSTIIGMYSYNVDPVMKLLHLPTFRQSLESGSTYLDCQANCAIFRALRSATFYVTFCSMTEASCLEYFGETKEVLRFRWQSIAEHWLRKADITESHHIVLLQALLLYIVSIT